MAVAFIVLIIALLFAFAGVRRTIREAQVTLVQLREDASQIRGELQMLIRDTRTTVHAIEQQIAAVEPFCASIREVGETVHHVTSSVTSVSNALTASAMQHVYRAQANNAQRIGDVIEWVDFGFGLWKKWQTHRSSRTGSAEPNE